MVLRHLTAKHEIHQNVNKGAEWSAREPGEGIAMETQSPEGRAAKTCSECVITRDLNCSEECLEGIAERDCSWARLWSEHIIPPVL